MKKFDSVSMEFNPTENGGETASLSVDFYDNGDGNLDGVFTIGTVTLQSYGNSAVMSVGGEITPKMLRDFADELQKKINTIWRNESG